ncbi:unnamed protein product [Commensalibacter communis]|uniref:tetratricopeptide repeat protein n=1 Tax=Commensalibacter communis TaxID=2972786 RepID=UPI0022FF4EB8|nr:tetratricopeptide repeat protein [Commensalibacter communis]CAI3954460.1 unnamed protein product [Commensalibacter communis]
MGWVDKLLAARDDRTAENLGDAYMKGDEGLSKNYTKAKDMYEKAIEFGSIEAIYKLADCYKEGLGVNKDISKVISLYEEAGRKGYVNGYATLEIMYEFGSDGVPQDKEKAKEYKRKKCEINPQICQ